MKAATATKDAPVRSAGRPPKEGGRLHLYLRADAKATMTRVSNALDAAGPTEVVRVVLRHLANVLTEERAKKKIVFVDLSTKGDEVYHTFAKLAPDDSAEKARLHVHLSQKAERDLFICEAITEESNSSTVVGVAIFTFAEALDLMEKGYVAMVENNKGERSAYTFWSTRIEAAKQKLSVG